MPKKKPLLLSKESFKNLISAIRSVSAICPGGLRALNEFEVTHSKDEIIIRSKTECFSQLFISDIQHFIRTNKSGSGHQLYFIITLRNNSLNCLIYL